MATFGITGSMAGVLVMNPNNALYRKPILGVLLIVLFSIYHTRVSAQHKDNFVRIARIVVDSAQLDAYNAAVKLHAETAVKAEPGVLMLYAVSEKKQPNHITVFEIYADQAAYETHIKTPHFLEYKATVATMVKSLELVDVTPISLESKWKKSRRK